MFRPKRKSLLFAAATFLFLLVISLAAWNRITFFRPPQNSPLAPPSPLTSSPPEGARRFDRFRLEGMSFNSTDPQGRKRFSLKAHRIEHRKRRIGPISLSPITEITLDGVQVAFYSYPDDQNKKGEERDLFPYPPGRAFQEMIIQNGLGIISRVIFTNITISLHEPNKNLWTLRADKANLNWTSKDLHFNEGFSFTTSSGDRLRSKRAVWLGEQNHLLVEGPYLLTRREGITQGMNALITVNREGKLTTHPMNPQINRQRPNQTLQ